MDKVTPISQEPKRTCGTCKFSQLEVMQGQIQRILVCHRFPPSMQMMSTPQGIAAQTMSPVVQPAMYCYEYQQREGQETSIVQG